MKQPTYKLIRAGVSGLQGFQDEINQHLTDGWELHGVTTAAQSDKHTVFVQAMVLPGTQGAADDE